MSVLELDYNLTEKKSRFNSALFEFQISDSKLNKKLKTRKDKQTAPCFLPLMFD